LQARIHEGRGNGGNYPLPNPVLLYSSETWVLTNREENRLLVLERKVLCTIFGLKIVDGVYRSRYNFKFDREFNSRNVIGLVKSNRLRYAGHMIRGVKDLYHREPCLERCQK
jgi:hypothetical protein